MALTATLVADFSSFQTAAKDASQAVGEFKASAEELGPAADKGLTMTKEAAQALGGQLRDVGSVAIESAKTFIAAYTEGEDVVNKLNSALENTGVESVPQVIEAYKALADEFQNTTKYGDESIIAITATLTTMGKVGPENMKLALDATTNLASALKIDLSAAADMVAKSIAKGNEPVGKLKTLLGDTATEGMSTVEMLGKINDKVGGAAQAELQTYNGQMEQMNNQMGEVNETVGKLLVENFGKLMNVFNLLPDGIKTFVLSVAGIAPIIMPLITSVAGLVSILGSTGIGAALVSAGTAIAAFIASIGLIPIAIAAAVAAVVYIGVQIYKNWDAIKNYTKQLYEGIKYWLVDQFMGLVNKIRGISEYIIGIFRMMYQAVVGGSIIPDMISGIAAEFNKLDTVMVDPVREAARAAVKEFGNITGTGLTTGFTGAGSRGGTVINITMTGMLGANDPQTRQAITQVVGDALAQSMRGQRLLSSA